MKAVALSGLVVFLVVYSCVLRADSSDSGAVAPPQPPSTLGAGDEVFITVIGLKELPTEAVQVSTDGLVSLPVIGKLKLAGLTLDEAEDAITERLAPVMRDPQVTVRIGEYYSQPVTVLGAVVEPGVHQLKNRKTLLEAISLAGGFKGDAGYRIAVTRDLVYGDIPIDGAVRDETGRYSVAQINLARLLSGTSPKENILVQPRDVVIVATAEIVYVLGEVRKAGGFVLREKENLSVLEALSLAEGLQSTAAARHARILRKISDDPEGSREEVAIDLRKMIDGKADDIALRPNDILVVPGSTSKKAVTRALEAAIQLGTGVLIWRR